MRSIASVGSRYPPMGWLQLHTDDLRWEEHWPGLGLSLNDEEKIILGGNCECTVYLYHHVSPGRSWWGQGYVVSISGTQIKPAVTCHSLTCTQLTLIRFYPDNLKVFSHALSSFHFSWSLVFSRVSFSYLVSSMHPVLCVGSFVCLRFHV